MANALLSTVNAARQRQPMCMECEKSLPNQIVFDKIESIIRLMQDEQNGLPVKTAKSFMSKIPSVFTGIDLIQWMMKNLKLEDQQEALHLANLIASHGYIFPIEDHTLSIKNDCTFYRFQTPCLWPSNNSEPENTDYAVYLCKRTMQGKTRLELADYEAENLARLQKMFSRKWEFIFMQAESQAKVDKKRDKLERKVLDSQERAFWDVYRPVPGCVNTTELDIKKACRLSKSAKRCSECQKVAAVAQGVALPLQPTAPSPDLSGPVASVSTSVGPTTLSQKSADLSTGAVLSKTVQIIEESADDAQGCKPPASETLDVVESKDESDSTKVKEPTEEADSGKQEQPTTASSEQPDDPGRPSEQPKPESAPEQSVKSSICSKAAAQTGAHHPHHHHHHHHHHHPHQHGHHHHHHHRQCPHHKHHQQSAAAGATGDQPAVEQPTGDSTGELPSRRLSAESSTAKQGDKAQPLDAARLQTPRKKQPGEHLIRAPSLQATHSGSCSRRRSECNRVFSLATADGPPQAPDSGGQLTVADPTACCSSSSTSLDHSPSALERPMNQRSVSNQSNLQQQHSQNSAQQHQPQQVATDTSHSSATGGSRQEREPRKSSLNILRSTEERPASAGTILSNRDGLSRKSSIQGHHPTGHQHSQLKSTQSVCTTIGSTSVSSELLIADHLVGQDKQNIGDLERELEALKVRLDRRIGGVKMSKVTQSYLSYFKQWAEYDPFVVQPIPSNPWISDSTELWDSERQTKDVHCRRVRRWAFSLKELLNDPAGREQFHRFLEKEFSAENLKFWDAVQELKRVHSRDVARRVEAIWTEYLAQDANCPINIDSKSYETSKRNMAKNKNNRYIFDEAAGHVYQLMKNDSYPRYLRSDMYKDYKEASEKKRSNQVAFDVFKPQITTLKHKFNF